MNCKRSLHIEADRPFGSKQLTTILSDANTLAQNLPIVLKDPVVFTQKFDYRTGMEIHICLRDMEVEDGK